MLQPRVLRLLGLVSAIAIAAVGPAVAQTQGGQITGTVSSSETGQPLGAVQVFIEGTTRGSITRTDGTFTIANVPAGSYVVVAQSIGYQVSRQSGVNVTNGGTTSLNFQLQTNVLALQEIVVTGLVDPVEGARSPITVAQVTREQMPVAVAASAATAVQGRVAGATMVRASGQPGSEVQMNLRTPTSALGSNQPMIVVDGVILGGNSVDIESMDIENIEVIKGAAAASLYGSRAAAGVIAITTARGRGLAAGTTQFSANTEYGTSEPANYGRLPMSHFYRADSEGYPINAAGERVPWSQRQAPPVAFMENPYPANLQLYDNLGSIYRPGGFNTQNFSVTSNHESTNFAASVNRFHEGGALEGVDGYTRNAFRVNLDHRFWNTMSLGISAYHARSFRDNAWTGGVGGVGGTFGNFLTVPPFLDLTARDSAGNFIRVPDPVGLPDYENPLWRQANRESESNRARSLGSANVRWSPFTWFSAAADVSFDREDSERMLYVPKGFAYQSDTYDGWLEYLNGLTDTFNGSLQGSLRRDFGPLNVRTTVRGLIERVTDSQNEAIGRDFRVDGVRSINAATFQAATSSEEEIRSSGYLWDTAFDYDGKYILSALGRRDGSSLFGPDNRWHNYYRVAGAWRVAEEPWFYVPGISEFKLKASRGTAGGRPRFANQYETWTLATTGVTKGTLGNRNLRPEHTTENEFGVELILFDRVGIELVHARQTTTDQLVNVALPAALGYGSQWVNSGSLKGNSTELSVEARLVNRPDLSWTTNIVADRSSSVITEWPQTCFVDSTTKVCEGSNIRDIWAYSYLRDGQLPTWFQDRSNEFQVNDDGYLVWVGAGNSFTEGRSKELWGTNGSVNGFPMRWGLPILKTDADGNPIHEVLGKGDPDFQVGWMNTLRYHGFTLHTQMHASVGNDIMNRTWQYLIYQQNSPEMDQTGKPEEFRKPISYYIDGLYNGARYVDHFIEDGSYLKLRTLSLSYRLGQSQLSRLGAGNLGVSGVEIGLIGRNLFTFDNYSGFDPEVVLDESQTSGGIGRLLPVDYYSYPNTRSYTVSVGVTF